MLGRASRLNVRRLDTAQLFGIARVRMHRCGRFGAYKAFHAGETRWLFSHGTGGGAGSGLGLLRMRNSVTLFHRRASDARGVFGVISIERGMMKTIRSGARGEANEPPTMEFADKARILGFFETAAEYLVDEKIGADNDEGLAIWQPGNGAFIFMFHHGLHQFFRKGLGTLFLIFS